MNFVHWALTIPRPSKRLRRAHSNAEGFPLRAIRDVESFGPLSCDNRLRFSISRPPLGKHAFPKTFVALHAVLFQTCHFPLLQNGNFEKLIFARSCVFCSTLRVVSMKVMRMRRFRSNNIESSILIYTYNARCQQVHAVIDRLKNDILRSDTISARFLSRKSYGGFSIFPILTTVMNVF